MSLYGRSIANPSPYGQASRSELRKDLKEVKSLLELREREAFCRSLAFKINTLASLVPIRPQPMVSASVTDMMRDVQARHNELTHALVTLSTRLVQSPTSHQPHQPLGRRATKQKHTRPENRREHFSERVIQSTPYLGSSYSGNSIQSQKPYKPFWSPHMKNHNSNKDQGFRRKRPRKLRSVVYAVWFIVRARRNYIQKKLARQPSLMNEMENAVKSFNSWAKDWLVHATRAPLMSIINAPKLDLASKEAKKPRFKWCCTAPKQTHAVTKTKVRVQGVIDGLIEYSTAERMPSRLRKFIADYTANGSFTPQTQLTSFERSRLSFDKFGALQDQTLEKQQMMVAFYFITKNLIKKLLLKPEALGVVSQPTVKANLRLLASLLQYLVLTTFAKVERSPREALEESLASRQPGESVGGNDDDGVSGKLLTVTELQPILRTLPEFLTQEVNSLRQWTETVVKLSQQSAK